MQGREGKNTGGQRHKALLFVIPTLGGGGAERNLVNMLSQLRHKYQCSVITFEPGGIYEQALRDHLGVDVILIEKSSNHLKFLLSLRRYIATSRPALLISFLHFASTAVYLASKGLGIPTISNERGNPANYIETSPKGWLRKWLLVRAYRSSDRVVFNSEANRVASCRLLGLGENTHTIANATDTEFILESARKPAPFHPGSCDLVCVGRLVEGKNQEQAIEVLARLAAQHPDIRLILLGDGPRKPRLMRLARDRGIAGQVIFPGYADNPFSVIARSRLTLFTSLHEGFPNAIIESMACGTPVIANDCPFGPGEIIESGRNGYLVSTGDIEGMTAAAHKLLIDSNLHQAVANAGMETAENYSVATMVNAFGELIETTIG